MKERPILFSAPMVRALLDGSKTMTRRVLKPQPDSLTTDGNPTRFFHTRAIGSGYFVPIHCPYGQPGDRLFVAREIPLVGRAYCAGTNGVIYSRARGDWRPLKPHQNSNGYPCVTVMIDGRKTTRAVHSLVCSAFYGEAPFSGAQVRHLDGNPSNSTPENLAWGTQGENWQDRRAHGNGMEGEKHHAAKLSDVERDHLRWAIDRRLCSQREAARVLGMTQSAIGQIMQGNELRPSDQADAGPRIPIINLEITSVRVERLQDISEADAIAEGVNVHPDHYGKPRTSLYSPVQAFRYLWESINGPESLDANPWVWVVSFRRAAA